MQNPRVLVGSPVTSLKEYCVDDYITCLKSLTYKNVEFLVLDNSPPDRHLQKKFLDAGIPYTKTPHLNNVREMLVRDRNTFRKKALDEGFDFWLSLEQDIVCPPSAVEQLIFSKKEIVSGAYFEFSHEKPGPIPRPDMFSFVETGEKKFGTQRRLFFEDLWPARVFEISSSGLGCMLINKTILEKIPFRFDEKTSVYDDVWFCKDAREKGLKIFLDSQVLCKHDARFHSKELLEKLGF